MLGERAIELIRELSRTKEDAVPPFNEENIRRVIEEMRALFDQNQKDASAASVAGDQSLIPSVYLRHAVLERDKRCLLTYLYNRLERIRGLRWDVGSVLPADIKSSLCEPEIHWFNNYNRNLAKYMRSIGSAETLPFDFTQDLVPPKSTVIKVRCLTDFGEYEFDDGTQMNLTKRNEFQMQRHLLEPLIRQGILEHIITK